MINDGRRPETFTPLRGDSWEGEIARESPRRKGVFPGLRPSLIAEKRLPASLIRRAHKKGLGGNVA